MNSMKIPKSSMAMRQGGFSALCLLMFIFLVGVAVYIALRISMSYFEFKDISTALEQVGRTEKIDHYPRKEVVNELKKIIQRNDSWANSELEADKIAYLIMRDEKKILGVNYEVAIPIVFNVSLLMHYKHEAILNPVVTK